jgi:mycofactocin precursor
MAQAATDLIDESTADAVDDDLVEDVLVEEVSIDGMCGVY